MKTRREQSLAVVFLFTAAVVITASTAMRYTYERINHEAPVMRRSYSVLGLLQAVAERAVFTTIAEASTEGKAAPVPSMSATKLIQSKDSFTISPIEKFTFEVGYKNTGTKKWESNTDKAKTVTLRARARSESYFYDPSWNSGTIVTEVPRSVEPGELVYFRFTLESPNKAGEYLEHLSLYYGGKKIEGSEFVLPITVTKSSSLSVKKSVERAQSQKKAVTLASAHQDIERFLEARKLIVSDTTLKLFPGESKMFEVGYKNIGKRAWKKGDLPHLTMRAFTDKERSAYYDPTTWQDTHVASYLQSDADTGQVSYFRFFLKAPPTPGKYKEIFYLAFGEEPIVGSDFTLPMEVIAPEPSKSGIIPSVPQSAVSAPQNPTSTKDQLPLENSEKSIQPPSVLPSTQSVLAFAPGQSPSSTEVIRPDIQEKEPLIRIGYFKTNDPVRITTQSPYQIWVGGTLFSTLSGGTMVSVSYEPAVGLYATIIDGLNHTSIEPPRFTGVVSSVAATDPETIFEIASYQNRPAWSSEINDNTVRGSLEVRYSQEAKALWVINELPLEYYLRGLAETSNSSPYEFQKALIIAARTYAKYHTDHGSKYPREGFTIRSTDHDQVYRGYGAEKRLPNVKKAGEETRGVIVTYQGQLAITPYYSQSDGRTRSWEEVWAGSPKPWLVGKDDPPGRGLPLLGHGVGMAARGAIAMALGGKSFDEILKYYYTGIELTQRYQ